MSGAAWVVVIVVVIVVGWYVDVRWHPTKPCPACQGSGRNRGSRPSAWGTCGRCGNKREVRRWGAGERN